MAADAFTILGGDRPSRWLVTCDHATNRVPGWVGGGSLGIAPEDMARHIAYDVGAAGLARRLAALLDAPAILSDFSRLVIDPNRGEDDPTLVMRLYDGTIVPGNRHVTPAEVERRLDDWHRPYHHAIEAAIGRMGEPALVSMHSYTPQLVGRPWRPWQVGILWHRDGRIAGPLLAGLRAQGYCVGDNEPYSGELEGDTMSRHGTARGLAHVLIELRQDLIATPEAQALWAGRLAPIIAGAIGEMADG